MSYSKKPVSYIAYCRISSENQLGENCMGYCSLDTQLERIKEFVYYNKGKIIATFQEVKSAYKNDLKNHTLILDIIRKYTNVVIVCNDVSRLCRNTSLFENIYKEAQNKQIRFASVFHNKIFTDKEELVYLVTEAQKESERIGQRLSFDIQQRKKNGAYVGGIAPYGYMIVKNKKGLRVLAKNAQEYNIVSLVKMFYTPGTKAEEIRKNLFFITGREIDFNIYEWNGNETILSKDQVIPQNSFYNPQDIKELLDSNGILLRDKNVTISFIKQIRSRDLTWNFNDMLYSLADEEEIEKESNEPKTGYFLYYKPGMKLPNGIPVPPSEGYIWIDKN